jgi:CHAT domain-containing protein/tetratricopeptide (TPR) repeat protein
MASQQPEQEIHELNQQVEDLHDQGKYAEALELARQVCELARRELGDNHRHTATSLSWLGYLLHATGDLAAARRSYEQALEIRRRVLGEDHPDTATSLNNLGRLLKAVGDLAGARPNLEQALAISRRVRGEDHPYTAISLDNLGSLLQGMGNLAAARPYRERALEVFRRVLGEDHPDTATSLNNLGSLLQDKGDLAAARRYYELALEARRRALGEGHPSTGTSFNNLGVLLQDMGDLAEARPHLEHALGTFRRVLGEDHPLTATALNNLGVLEVASGKIDEALALMRQATATDDRLIGQVSSTGSDRQRLLFLRKVQGDQERFLSLVYRYLAGSPEAVRMALDLVLRRKALGAEALAAQRDTVLSGRYPHLREAFDQLTQLRRRLAQKTLAGPAAGETLAAHEQTLRQWRQEQQQRETTLARQIHELNLEQQFHKADRRAVALALPEAVALVEFVRFRVFDFHAVPARGEPWWQPARYLAFVLPAGQPDEVQMIDLGEADPIDRLIADFRAGVAADPHDRPDRDVRRRRAGAPPAAQGQAGPALRAAVFDRLVPALGGRTRLLLAPDGDLARLPFEVLPDAEGRLLLEEYGISYLGCGRDVLRFGAAPTRPPADPLVVADPLFDLAADGAAAPASAHTPASRCSRDIRHSGYQFRRLPGTRQEGERVADLLGVRPWLGPDALEGRLKQARSPRVLHLATHGFFLEDQPHDPNQVPDELARAGDEGGSFGRLAGALPENPLLRSGLALAGAQTWLDGAAPPEEAEDGLLTAEDVTGLDLLDTQLVVLSACETGLGEVHTGEGVLGLRRAFVVAGARTLVVSLWKVPDEQTRELMIDFYTHVLSGDGVADSLRRAQLAMRERHPDPYFWGAFVCQGDPGPLPARAWATSGPATGPAHGGVHEPAPGPPPAPSPGESAPAQSSLRRHTDVTFPNVVLLSEEATLRVRLVLPERGFAHPHDAPLDLEVPPSGAVRVRVSVAAERFRIVPPSSGELEVPRDRDSAPLHFRLQAMELGKGRVMLDFWQAGHWAGSVDLQPEIVSAPATEGPSSCPSPASLDLGGERAPTPQVHLLVYQDQAPGQQGRLRFQLYSEAPGLAGFPVMHGDLGEVRLTRDVERWVQEQLEDLAGGGRPGQAGLERFGRQLFDKVLPEQVRQLYWRMRELKLETILIVSDEPHIPWELIRAHGGEGGAEGDFWGAEFVLTRWLRVSGGPFPRLTVRRVRALAAEAGGSDPPARDVIRIPAAPDEATSQAGPHTPILSPPLPGTAQEMEVLRSLERCGAEVRILAPRRDELARTLAAGGFELLHLACHGDFGGAGRGDFSCVLLEDGEFRVNHLDPQIAGGLGRDLPLVFLNACHTGRLGFSLTGLGCWAAELLRLGCGAFIGTLWRVSDGAALAFATSFYEAVQEGHCGIGEAVRRARRAVRERFPGDTTWLAYTCFASPLAPLRLPGADAAVPG